MLQRGFFTARISKIQIFRAINFHFVTSQILKITGEKYNKNSGKYEMLF